MSIARRLVPLDEETAPFKIGVTVTSGQTFTLPIADFGGLTPNFGVSWGDGSSGVVTSSTDADRIHTYSTGGTYTITITGLMPSFKVANNSAIKLLITSIIDFGRVGLRELDFYGCISISSIPASATMVVGYEGLDNIITFGNFMRSTGITSIPSDLFNYSTSATTFTDSFSFTSITSIPSGLFDNNISATNFSSCFNNCQSLSSCPSDLFDNNVNVVNFSSTFRNCKSLTEPLQFTFNTLVSVFNNIYNMNTTANAMTGTAPELWNRVPEPSGFRAFYNCVNLTNYASIPANWK
jgi:hypothetical protein